MTPHIVFDFDGVIVDSEKYWPDVETRYFRDVLPEWSEEDQHDTMGRTMVDIMRMIEEKYGISYTDQEIADLYATLADEVYARAELMPGANSLLQTLQEQGIHRSIASSAHRDRIEGNLKRFSLEHLFDDITSADDLSEGEGKPHPAIYQKAAERAGRNPSDCIAIEDARNGILSAKAADMTCIAFRNGINDGQDLSEADYEVRKLGEVMGIVQTL